MSAAGGGYADHPFLVIWETTQACDLACRHCRASAHPGRAAAELTTAEGEDLLRQIAAMGTRIVVLSGGDPLQRDDLFHLVRFGADLGLRMATIPAATPRLTETVIDRFVASGLSQMALSIDFPDAARHDAFRGVEGSFDRTLAAAGWARARGLPLQINTTLHAGSAESVEGMLDLVARLGAVFWEVFFLVPTGRGTALGGLTPEACEAIFAILYRAQKTAPFLIKVTEAPHYRRHVADAERREAGGAPDGAAVRRLPRALIRTEGPGGSIGLAPRGVNAGNGFLFVSHTGLIYPSGFLPLAVGDLRVDRLATVYREAPLLRDLRDPRRLQGACGVCACNAICGGSRARAFALTGNPFASDPWCIGPSPGGTPVAA
jgi:radical SAM protein